MTQSRGRLFGSSMIASKLVYAAAQGVQLVIIARFGGSVDVGLYALALAIVSPIFLLTNLRLQDILATQESAGREWRNHLLLTCWTNGAGVLCVVALALAWGRPELLAVMVPLALAKLMEALMRTAYGYAQGQGRRKDLVLSTLARAATSTAALALGYAVSGLVTGLWLVAAAWAVQCLAYERRFLPWGGELESNTVLAPEVHASLGRLFVTLVPLGASAMFLSLNQSLIRLVVEGQVGLEELGVFASVAYLVRIGAVAARGVAEVTVGRLRRSRGERYLWDAVRLPTALVGLAGAVGGALVVLAGPAVFPVIFGPDFVPTTWLLIGVMSAGIFIYMSTALSLGVVATGGHRRQLIIVAGTTALTLALAFALVGPLGMAGAAAAWAVGEALRAALLAVQVRSARGQPERVVTL